MCVEYRWDTILVKKNHQKLSSRNKFGTSSDLKQVHNLSRFGTSYELVPFWDKLGTSSKMEQVEKPGIFFTNSYERD